MVYSRVCFPVSLKTKDIFRYVCCFKLHFPCPHCPPQLTTPLLSASTILRKALKLKEPPPSSWPLGYGGPPPAQTSALFSISIHFLGHPTQSHGFDSIHVLILLTPWSPNPRKSSRYFRLNISKLEIWFLPLNPKQLLPQYSPFRNQDHQSSVLSLPVLQPESKVPS